MDAQTITTIVSIVGLVGAMFVWGDRKLERRFDQIDKQFDRIDAKFDRMDAKFDALETKFDSKFEKVNDQIFALASGLKPLVEQAKRSDAS